MQREDPVNRQSHRLHGISHGLAGANGPHKTESLVSALSFGIWWLALVDKIDVESTCRELRLIRGPWRVLVGRSSKPSELPEGLPIIRNDQMQTLAEKGRRLLEKRGNPLP